MRRLATLLTALTFIISMFSACAKSEQPLTAAELLDLGEKYLLEVNYEQALVQFLKVIEVEPMNPRGYTGAAEAHVGLGEHEKAIDVLKQGMSILPENTDIQSSFDKLHSSETTSVASFDDSSDMRLFLLDMLDKYENEGYESIYTAIASREYQDLLSDLTSYPMICLNDADDYGIGLYNAGEFLYIGNYVDSSRSGIGFWIMLKNPQEGQYRFEGEWSNDLPNGLGLRYSGIRDSWGTWSGNLVDGFWDGEVIEKSSDIVGFTHSSLTLSKGKFVVIGDVDDDGNYPIGYFVNDTSRIPVAVSENQLNSLFGILGCYDNS